MQTMQLIQTAAEVNKAIASISNRGAKLDADIHRVGVSVLMHATKHGDSTLADKLVHAMPKGARKIALVEWMLAFGQVAKLDPKADKQAIIDGRLFKLDRTKQYDEAGAIGTPWTEFKPEGNVLDAFDAQAAVASVVSRLTKAAQAGKTIKGRAEALAQIDALRAALAAESVLDKAVEAPL